MQLFCTRSNFSHCCSIQIKRWFYFGSWGVGGNILPICSSTHHLRTRLLFESIPLYDPIVELHVLSSSLETDLVISQINPSKTSCFDDIVYLLKRGVSLWNRLFSIWFKSSGKEHQFPRIVLMASWLPYSSVREPSQSVLSIEESHYLKWLARY